MNVFSMTKMSTLNNNKLKIFLYIYILNEGGHYLKFNIYLNLKLNTHFGNKIFFFFFDFLKQEEYYLPNKWTAENKVLKH